MFNMHMCPIPLFSVIWCQANEKKKESKKKMYKHELVKIIFLLLFPRKEVYFFFPPLLITHSTFMDYIHNKTWHCFLWYEHIYY